MSSSATTFEVPAEDLSALFIHGFTPMSEGERQALSTELLVNPPSLQSDLGPMHIFIRDLNDLESNKFFSIKLAFKGRYFIFVSNYRSSGILLWHIALQNQFQFQYNLRSWSSLQPLMRFMEREMKNSDLAVRIFNED